MSRYTKEHFVPFIGDGRASNLPKPLPNVTDEDPMRFLQDLAARGHMMEPVWGYALLPDGSRQQWTQFFLLYDAIGGGTGYAVTYGPSRWEPSKDGVPGRMVELPIVRRFKICQHEKVLHADAHPERGWSPGHCKLCGMDMTVDSSG